MHITSKSLKRTAGALALTLSVVSAAFGLTACGGHGGDGRAPTPVPKSAPIGIGHTLQ
jgi:hypothetical protein